MNYVLSTEDIARIDPCMMEAVCDTITDMSGKKIDDVEEKDIEEIMRAIASAGCQSSESNNLDGVQYNLDNNDFDEGEYFEDNNIEDENENDANIIHLVSPVNPEEIEVANDYDEKGQRSMTVNCDDREEVLNENKQFGIQGERLNDATENSGHPYNQNGNGQVTEGVDSTSEEIGMMKYFDSIVKVTTATVDYYNVKNKKGDDDNLTSARQLQQEVGVKGKTKEEQFSDVCGKLPSASDILQCRDRWDATYESNDFDIEASDSILSKTKDVVEEFQSVASVDVYDEVYEMVVEDVDMKKNVISRETRKELDHEPTATHLSFNTASKMNVCAENDVVEEFRNVTSMSMEVIQSESINERVIYDKEVHETAVEDVDMKKNVISRETRKELDYEPTATHSSSKTTSKMDDVSVDSQTEDEMKDTAENEIKLCESIDTRDILALLKSMTSMTDTQDTIHKKIDDGTSNTTQDDDDVQKEDFRSMAKELANDLSKIIVDEEMINCTPVGIDVDSLILGFCTTDNSTGVDNISERNSYENQKSVAAKLEYDDEDDVAKAEREVAEIVELAEVVSLENELVEEKVKLSESKIEVPSAAEKVDGDKKESGNSATTAWIKDSSEGGKRNDAMDEDTEIDVDTLLKTFATYESQKDTSENETNEINETEIVTIMKSVPGVLRDAKMATEEEPVINNDVIKSNKQEDCDENIKPEKSKVENSEKKTEHSEKKTEHSESKAEHSESEAEHSESEAEHSKSEAEHSEKKADSKDDSRNEEINSLMSAITSLAEKIQIFQTNFSFAENDETYNVANTKEVKDNLTNAHDDLLQLIDEVESDIQRPIHKKDIKTEDQDNSKEPTARSEDMTEEQSANLSPREIEEESMNVSPEEIEEESMNVSHEEIDEESMNVPPEENEEESMNVPPEENEEESMNVPPEENEEESMNVPPEENEEESMNVPPEENEEENVNAPPTENEEELDAKKEKHDDENKASTHCKMLANMLVHSINSILGAGGDISLAKAASAGILTSAKLSDDKIDEATDAVIAITTEFSDLANDQIVGTAAAALLRVMFPEDEGIEEDRDRSNNGDTNDNEDDEEAKIADITDVGKSIKTIPEDEQKSNTSLMKVDDLESIDKSGNKDSCKQDELKKVYEQMISISSTVLDAGASNEATEAIVSAIMSDEINSSGKMAEDKKNLISTAVATAKCFKTEDESTVGEEASTIMEESTIGEESTIKKNNAIKKESTIEEESAKEEPAPVNYKEKVSDGSMEEFKSSLATSEDVLLNPICSGDQACKAPEVVTTNAPLPKNSEHNIPDADLCETKEKDISPTPTIQSPAAALSLTNDAKEDTAANDASETQSEIREPTATIEQEPAMSGNTPKVEKELRDLDDSVEKSNSSNNNTKIEHEARDCRDTTKEKIPLASTNDDISTKKEDEPRDTTSNTKKKLASSIKNEAKKSSARVSSTTMKTTQGSSKSMNNVSPSAAATAPINTVKRKSSLKKFWKSVTNFGK